MDPMLFGLFLLAAGASAATGILFPPGAWYRALAKPAWVPPNRAFPVVWTVLYLLMAWAAARVAHLPGSGTALALWAVQMGWNTLWTPVFFGLHRMRAALAIIAGLWVAVALCAVAFATLDPLTLIAWVPYLAWVSVAAALNAAILRLNPDAP